MQILEFEGHTKFSRDKSICNDSRMVDQYLLFDVAFVAGSVYNIIIFLVYKDSEVEQNK